MKAIKATSSVRSRRASGSGGAATTHLTSEPEDTRPVPLQLCRPHWTLSRGAGARPHSFRNPHRASSVAPRVSWAACTYVLVGAQYPGGVRPGRGLHSVAGAICSPPRPAWGPWLTPAGTPFLVSQPAGGGSNRAGVKERGGQVPPATDDAVFKELEVPTGGPLTMTPAWRCWQA